jgi:DNA-binding NarL/FixJ family response regulator
VPITELTAIEQQVVLLVAGGQSCEAIAHDLHLSVRTVEWHVERARLKLGRAAALHERVRQADEPPVRKED